MHVLLTVNAAWNVWNFRRPVLDALRARGDRITVLAPPDGAEAHLLRGGAQYVPLAMDVRGLNPLHDAALAWRMDRHFHTQAPDVILSWTIKANIFGALAARRRGIPFIPNVSGLGTAFLSGGALQRLVEGLYRIAFRGLDTVFFQNPEDRNLFLARGLVHEGQAYLLPGSGIDLVRFAPAPWPEGPPVFLMIARLLRDKGVIEFVQAARRVRAIHPQVRFQLLGAAGVANRSAIHPDTVADWVAEGAVEHLGTTDDVRPAIAAAHCIVLPSYREGAPRTLIEGAALARPLIATDVPGCRQVVEEGQTGLLCRIRDADSLAEACLRLLSLPVPARAAMGQAGRRKMEAEYDEQLVVAAYLAAIDRVLAGGRQGGRG
jgi:glycosyltransferase involved in cell wall biosynthesis